MAPTRKNRKTKSRQTRKIGLNKVENKQVDSKIKSAIRNNNTLKYFHANSSDNAQSPNVSSVSDKQEVSVIGYSSTTEFDNVSPATALKYGQQDLYPMYMTRPFGATATGLGESEQALDGQNVLPKVARAQFSIERVGYTVSPDGSVPTDLFAARSLPISYRIIKVDFKSVTGTTQTSNPNVDLFISTTGQEKGIDSNAFDRLDCKYARINTKKYTKLMDIQGTINQNNIFTPTSLPSDMTTDIITGKNGKSFMDLVVNFQLSERKNGKLFYSKPNATGADKPNGSTSGSKRQMLFYHFWYDNGHLLLGGAGQPVAPVAADLQIKVRCESAFVDTA